MDNLRIEIQMYPDHVHIVTGIHAIVLTKEQARELADKLNKCLNIAS
jgi:hypothetical protein